MQIQVTPVTVDTADSVVRLVKDIRDLHTQMYLYFVIYQWSCVRRSYSIHCLIGISKQNFKFNRMIIFF